MAEQLDATLFYAANTDDVIRWDKLREKLAAAPPALTERERCELIVDAANGRRLTGRQWNQLVGAAIQIGADDKPVPLPPQAQAGVVAALGAITDGSEADRTALAQWVDRVASESVLIAPSFTRKHVRAERVVAEGIPGGLVYTLWLLLDPQRPFGRDLCRCQYSECRMFFFKLQAEGRGAPRRKYCNKSRHAELGDKEKARKRMADLRRER